jgi:hypothetical protein
MQRAKRWGAFGGVVLAAVATIATSAPPDWSEEDAVEGLSARLDTTAPETVHHFMINSSQSHTARLRGTFDWSDEPDPQAAVRIRIERDSGGAAETIVRAADFDAVDTNFELTLTTDCPGSCQEGYTATLELVDGWPSEHVQTTWSFGGQIGGEGMEEPNDAFITVTEE